MNMLFLFTDQQRVDTLSCYGNAELQTPAADRLAREGVRFDRAYTPNAVCTPARASLLTGLMPHKHRILVNFERNVGYPATLSSEHVTFSRCLKEASYNVGLEGKWHVSEIQPPQQFGFDAVHFPGVFNGYDHPAYTAYLKERGLARAAVRPFRHGTMPSGKKAMAVAGVFEGPVEATFEYFLAIRAIRKLRSYAEDFEARGRQFYLALHWFGPHLPYIIPESYYNFYNPDEVALPASFGETFKNKPRVQQFYSRYWRFDDFSEDEWKKLIAIYRGYARMIDDLAGMVLEEVDRLGLNDSTAVFFGTDHGEFTGSHKLNDKGPAMYEDIYRVPLIIRMPPGRAGAVESRFVSLVDLTTRFLDMARVESPSEMDGRSLIPLLRGDSVDGWRSHILCEFHGRQFPYPQRMIRDERYKLIITPADVSEFYDLQKDPFELVNAFDDPGYRKERIRLTSILLERLKEERDNFYSWVELNFETSPEEVSAAGQSR